MDGVELARQIAADLHRNAVERGLDPWSPYAFAVSEAERRDIDVEPTAVGAAILDGARAVLVSKDDLILHESIGSPFEDAFLVAHEIGHIELGDDSQRAPVRSINPARPAEPSPVGIDRVVDYGRRQRREIQMDLFAREFLLPRPVVRTLHVDEGLPASQIAERMGAPFEVVAQQLLDALLLPPIVPGREDEAQERPPNPLQVAAAAHRGKAYLLEAGPGTGKTQTLVARVDSLLDEGVDPRRIRTIGYSKFDICMHNRRELGFADPARPTVLYNPHPSPRLSSWYTMGTGLLEALAATGEFNLVFAPHGMMFARKWTVTVRPPAISRMRAPASRTSAISWACRGRSSSGISARRAD